MEKSNALYLEVKPILLTYLFEIKQHKKKFLIFTCITVLLSFLDFILFAVFPENSLAETYMDFYRGGTGILYLIILFAVCFFFSGIICAEFSNKTGYVVFPKINKYKLIVGKYLGNLTLIIGVIVIHYFIHGLLGLYYYGGTIPIQYYYSLGIAILYIVALSGFVTLFSSFMKSVNMTIVSTILILLIVYQIVDQIVALSSSDVEPLYSFSYLSGLITYIINEKFPTERYEDFEFEGFIYRVWNTPTIEMGIIVMLLYMIICLTLAALIFKRKQL